MTARTMRGDRLHIAIFGRRNAGKSSLFNALTGQPVSIVSEVPGTTTDPVFKAMEIAGIGPVALIDTAGLDDADVGLGAERKRRTGSILAKTDLAILVVEATAVDFSFEDQLQFILGWQGIPVITVANKSDLPRSGAAKKWLAARPHMAVSARTGEGINLLKQQVISLAPRQWEPPFLLDLIRPGDWVVLVVPIDLGAPKGRIIMPQVKALREVLDGSGTAVMCKESELKDTLAGLKRKPALVVTDSQAFSQVAAAVPDDIPLTSFSILSIRQKGDLPAMVAGVLAVKGLRPGDRVLVAEACTHHPQEGDIGRVKIPLWLTQHAGGELDIQTVSGCEFPAELADYRLVIHCGACTFSRREMLHRQALAAAASVPMTNYGVLIAYLKSVFPRALSPFSDLYALFSGDESRGAVDAGKSLCSRGDV